MSKLSKNDIYDIREYILLNIEDYSEAYVKYGSYLPFSDYVQTRISTQLAHKFDRYVIQEAFDSDKIQALLKFYLPEEEDVEKSTH